MHAGEFHHHRGFRRGAFFGGLALGALAAAPYAYSYYDPNDYGYYPAYDFLEPDCYLVPVRIVYNRWGDEIIQRVRVCY